MPEKVNLLQKFEKFSDLWSPKVVGEVNDFAVKLVKIQGEFVWHHHDGDDEMFLVTKGRFTMRLKDGDVDIREGEFIIIPAGVEHQPVAEEECHVLLFEPRTVVNTGSAGGERTVKDLERL